MFSFLNVIKLTKSIFYRFDVSHTGHKSIDLFSGDFNQSRIPHQMALTGFNVGNTSLLQS